MKDDIIIHYKEKGVLSDVSSINKKKDEIKTKKNDKGRVVTQVAVLLLPRDTKCFAISKHPHCAAMKRGDTPNLLLMSSRAPFARRSSASGRLPLETASYRGVFPRWLRAFAFAPWLNKIPAALMFLPSHTEDMRCGGTCR